MRARIIRQKLLALERLHEVIVGAGVEALDAVVQVGARGEDQHRDIVVGAAPQHLDAVQFREAQVEDHDVGHELRGGGERLLAVAASHLVALWRRVRRRTSAISWSSSTTRTRPVAVSLSSMGTKGRQVALCSAPLARN